MPAVWDISKSRGWSWNACIGASPTGGSGAACARNHPACRYLAAFLYESLQRSGQVAWPKLARPRIGCGVPRLAVARSSKVALIQLTRTAGVDPLSLMI